MHNLSTLRQKLYWLHLPPWFWIFCASLASMVLGPLLLDSMEFFDILLRIPSHNAWLMPIIALVLLGSAWRREGNRLLRIYAQFSIFIYLGLAVLDIVGMGSLWQHNAMLMIFFGAIPLYLRRVSLTEEWLQGSLRPLFLCFLSFLLPPLVVMFLIWGYAWSWQLRAEELLHVVQTTQKAISQLQHTGSLSEQEIAAFVPESFPDEEEWLLAVAASPKKEVSAKKSLHSGVETELEEGLSMLLETLSGAVQSPPVLGTQIPWEAEGTPGSSAQQKYHVRVRSYWDQLASLTGGGALLSSLHDRSFNIEGLEARKNPPEVVDLQTRLQAMRIRMQREQDVFNSLASSRQADITRYSEASGMSLLLRKAAWAKLPTRCSLAELSCWEALTIGSSVALDVLPLFQDTELESRLIADQCYAERYSKTNSRSYSCAAYTLENKAFSQVWRLRVVFLFTNKLLREIRWEVVRPKTISTWKGEVLALWKKRGFAVQKKNDGSGYTLSQPNTPMLSMQFVESREKASFRLQREAVTP